MLDIYYVVFIIFFLIWIVLTFVVSSVEGKRQRKYDRIYKDKNILVVGCQRGGIGEELVNILADRGANVFVVDISATVEQMRRDHVTVLVQDLTAPDAIERVMKACISHFHGRLDALLMLQAFMPKPGFVSSLTPESIQRCLDVTLKAGVLLIINCLPFLEQSKGCIGYSSSGSVFLPMGLMGMYRTVKAGLSTFIESVSSEQEMKGTGTTCTVVPFSAVKTGLYDMSVEEISFGDSSQDTPYDTAVFFLEKVMEDRVYIYAGPLPNLDLVRLIVPFFPGLFRFVMRNIMTVKPAIYDRDRTQFSHVLSKYNPK